MRIQADGKLQRTPALAKSARSGKSKPEFQCYFIGTGVEFQCSLKAGYREFKFPLPSVDITRPTVNFGVVGGAAPRDGEFFEPGDVERRWISRVEAALAMPRGGRRTAVTGMGWLGRR